MPDSSQFDIDRTNTGRWKISERYGPQLTIVDQSRRTTGSTVGERQCTTRFRHCASRKKNGCFWGANRHRPPLMQLRMHSGAGASSPLKA
jgi:hypothetical protein